MSDQIALTWIEDGYAWIRSFSCADDYARQCWMDGAEARGMKPGKWKDFKLTSDENDTAFYDACVNVWNEAKRTESTSD